MKMVNMKMSKAERKETVPVASEPEGPEYPYGICLNLNKETIEKLGLGTPKAGATLMLHAMVEVKSVTVTDEKDGKGYKSMDLQITDMALEKGGGMGTKKVAESLYGKA